MPTPSWITPEYVAYLGSAKWRAKANACKERAGYRCECRRKNCPCSKRWGRCKARGLLHANHLTYVRLYHELPTDLEALCPPCHDFYTALTRRLRKRRRTLARR